MFRLLGIALLAAVPLCCQADDYELYNKPFWAELQTLSLGPEFDGNIGVYETSVRIPRFSRFPIIFNQTKILKILWSKDGESGSIHRTYLNFVMPSGRAYHFPNGEPMQITCQQLATITVTEKMHETVQRDLSNVCTD